MTQFIHKVIFFDLGLTLVKQNTKQWNDGAKDLLAHLRAAGVRLGVISNTGGQDRTQLLPLLPNDFKWDLFETNLIVLSGEVHVEKPNLDIFRKAVTKAGLPAQQCLYCSEDLKETLAAQRAGMSIARLIPVPASDLSKLEAALLDVAALP